MDLLHTETKICIVTGAVSLTIVLISYIKIPLIMIGIFEADGRNVSIVKD